MKRETTLKAMLLIAMLFFLSGCSPLFGSRSYVRPPLPNVPRTYNAEYNRVWNSALDTLDEAGYVIAQMDKADGYITTDRKENRQYRSKVSLRIVRTGNEVRVSVKKYTENREISSFYSTGEARTYSSWRHYSTKGYDEKRIKDAIAEKLGLAQ